MGCFASQHLDRNTIQVFVRVRLLGQDAPGIGFINQRKKGKVSGNVDLDPGTQK